MYDVCCVMFEYNPEVWIKVFEFLYQTRHSIKVRILKLNSRVTRVILIKRYRSTEGFSSTVPKE